MTVVRCTDRPPAFTVELHANVLQPLIFGTAQTVTQQTIEKSITHFYTACSKKYFPLKILLKSTSSIYEFILSGKGIEGVSYLDVV